MLFLYFQEQKTDRIMGTRVYIGRIPYQAREKDVERFFRHYGKIRDLMLKNGYGFVVSAVCNS